MTTVLPRRSTVRAVIPPDVLPPWPLRALRATRVWLVLVASVGVWELAVAVLDVPNYLVPAPSAVVRELLVKPELYLGALGSTALAAVLGFAAAVVVGVVLGVLFARSPLVEELVYPFLNIVRVTPTVAIAPLLTIWFGRGLVPVVVAAFLIAFFPVLVQVVLGVASADRQLVDVLRIANASELSVLRKVQIPNAMPYLFSSFRVAAPGAVVGALLGEFLGASTGLGYLITVASGQLNTSAVFLLAGLSCVLGIALFQVCVLLERRLVRWHPSVRL
ncbi:ABC transporter permease [Klenkia brasiliensis]|uniref:NitT/TauT family transport system permease protein n=1 Tax=Klenkia brasiliensis TaxID=333142 RepID=A0A1G7SUT5_9ACTN|nr:ABC transporter permease [Klenkia brasiliensis]SDG26827.1 NitT/TauT family transport system permease protein [Klenkia brasiliensis]